MSPDDPRHGSTAGYNAHRASGTKTCAKCKAARLRYEKRRINDHMQGRPRLIDATGTKRRVRGLVALGWTYREIGGRMDVSISAIYQLLKRDRVHQSVADRVAEVYDQMSMTLPPTVTRQQKRDASYARTVARKHGWLPPLAWNNIDDVNERPEIAPATDENSIDDAVVERILAGDRVQATAAEKREAMRRWVAGGRSARSLALAQRWHDGRYAPRKDGAA